MGFIGSITNRLVQLIDPAAGGSSQPSNTATPKPTGYSTADTFVSGQPKSPVALTVPSGTSVSVSHDQSALDPTGGTAEPATEGAKEESPVEVDAGTYVKGSYSVSDSKTNPGLHETQTLTITGETGVYAKAGADLKAFSFEGKVYSGVRTTYSATVSPDQAKAIQSGQAPMPNPYDPSSIPTGGKVVMKGDDVAGTEVEAAWHHLAVSTGHEDFKGMAVGVEKTDDTHVKLTVGPEQGVTNELFAGVDAGPVKVGVGNETTETTSTMKTVTLDLSTPGGKAAYQKFLLTGEIPKQDPANGVDKVGTIKSYSMDSQSAIEAQLGPIGGKLALGSSGAEITETTYEDGTVERESRFDYGDKSAVLTQSIDANGKENVDEQKVKLLMNNVDPVTASYVNSAFTGKENVKFDGNQQIELDFTPEQFQQLKEKAQAYCEKMYPGWKPTTNPYDSNVNGGPEDVFLDRIASAQSPADLQGAFINNIGGTGSMGEALLKLAAATQQNGQWQLPGSYSDAKAA